MRCAYIANGIRKILSVHVWHRLCSTYARTLVFEAHDREITKAVSIHLSVVLTEVVWSLFSSSGQGE